MTSARFIGCVFAASALTSSASATIVRFTDFGLWSYYSTLGGASVVTETFSGVADGFHASPYSGSTGGINWTAIAAGGLFASGGQFSTNAPEAITFAVSPGVQGIGGNFYGTDADFNVVPAIVQVTLNDGSAYIGFATSPSEFIGFYSTAAEITSVSISSSSLSGAANVYPTADNLYFAAVPAPGAISVLALAGMLGNRRRR